MTLRSRDRERFDQLIRERDLIREVQRGLARVIEDEEDDGREVFS